MIEQSLLDLGFRPLFDASPDATVVIDSLGKVVALNHEVERLLGWAEPELLGQPMNRLIPARFHRILDTQPIFNPEPQESQPTRSASSPGGATEASSPSRSTGARFEVDSEPVLNRLRHLGIGYAQGHAVALPVPLADSQGEMALPCFQQLM